MSLVLTRKDLESCVIGGGASRLTPFLLTAPIVVTIQRTRNGQTQLLFEAQHDLVIDRQEVYESKTGRPLSVGLSAAMRKGRRGRGRRSVGA